MDAAEAMLPVVVLLGGSCVRAYRQDGGGDKRGDKRAGGMC